MIFASDHCANWGNALDGSCLCFARADRKCRERVCFLTAGLASSYRHSERLCAS